MHLPLPLCFLSSLSTPGLWAGLTINHHCGRQAPPLGYDVGCHAGVVPGVREPRLPDDEVVVCSGVDVLILFRVYGLLIFQPFHLSEVRNVYNSLTHTHTNWVVRAYGTEMYITHRMATHLYPIHHPIHSFGIFRTWILQLINWRWEENISILSTLTYFLKMQ